MDIRHTSIIVFFIEGDPQALLIVEFRSDDPVLLQQKAEALKKRSNSERTGLCISFYNGSARDKFGVGCA